VIDISYIHLAQLIVDFGLLILIWLVQLVIYPGLTFYATRDLKVWHQKYTSAVTLIVLPLMVSQLILSLYSLVSAADTFYLIHTLLVLTAWAHTFIIAVPLHQKLEGSDNPIEVAESLVSKNKWRVLIWTLVFMLSLKNICF